MNIHNFITNLFQPKHKSLKGNVESNKVYVTMDWAGNPITTKGDGYILPRNAEMILNKQYYPNGIIGEWPCDPNTGEKLPIVPMKK